MDLRDAANYISTRLFAPISADRKVKRIREALGGRLSFMPEKYRLVDAPRLASKGYRMMNVENYIAFFTIDEDNSIVWVERIIHGKRDWKHILS